MSNVTGTIAIGSTNGYYGVSNGSNIVNVVPLSQSAQEDVFEFLKNNLRVAEYTDDAGKLLYVELQMRAGEGYVWDKIRRVRLKETDDML